MIVLELEVIKETPQKRITLVRELDKRTIYIKKELKAYNKEVWKTLKELDLQGIPHIYSLKENEEEKVEPAHVITYVFQKEEDNRTVYSIVLLFCMLAIGIRSYVGSMITVKTDWFLWPAIFACMGKAFGGVLADRFGVRKIALGSLAISGICLWIPGDIVVIRLMGVFLFNFVMPITLYILYEQFAHQPGFAFGLSTLALFLGILPGYFLNIAEEFYHGTGLDNDYLLEHYLNRQLYRIVEMSAG